MVLSTIRRRSLVKAGAAAAALPLVHIRSAGAAGKLAVGFWDHWVPAGNDAMRKQVQAWAEKNKVEVQADYITGVGNKLLLTIAAEAQARTGHDMLAFFTWQGHQYAERLEPVDDVMDRLTAAHGPVNKACEYLWRANGRWIAVPTSSGSQNLPPCARVSLLKSAAGIDPTALYPPREEHVAAQDSWTWDALLLAAEACQKAGMPMGIGLGTTSDSAAWTGALFSAFGAELVDGKGNVTVRTDPVRQVLEFGRKLAKFLPPDVTSYDDASNNRALIAGKASLIFNPPSAWAVAKRDAPQVAADCWTFAMPAGPKGRFVPYAPFAWGVWNFSPNKNAAKELIEYLMQRPQVEERTTAVQGFDLPPFLSMTDFPVWAEVEPPKGTVFNYPTRKSHNAVQNIASSSAPPEIAVQIYNAGTMPSMLARLMGGQSIDQVIGWAEGELNGFARR